VTVHAVEPGAVAVGRAGRLRAERMRLEGSYAGGVSRLLAYALDTFVVTASFALVAGVVQYVVSTVFPVDLDLGDEPVGSGIALSVWSFNYFTYSLATAGRTLGKALVGLRVVVKDGSHLRVGRAALRVLTMPLSFLLFGLGLLPILVRADRRALHDLIAGTAEIYSCKRVASAR
jgi:uncharacterized RDD family membrane protein YckC